MKTRTGFVIEFNVRSKDGRTFPPSLLSSKEFGEIEFHDLTNPDYGSNNVIVDHDIEGQRGNLHVTYSCAFVVI